MSSTFETKTYKPPSMGVAIERIRRNIATPRDVVAHDCKTSCTLILMDACVLVAVWGTINGLLQGANVGALTFVTNSVFVLWCLGLYPARFSSPSNEMRQIGIAWAIIFACMSFRLQSVSLALLAMTSMGAVIHFMVRFFGRKKLANYEWWQCPVHIYGNEEAKQVLTRWLDRRGYYALRVVPLSQPAMHLIADESLSLAAYDEFPTLSRDYPRLSIVGVHGSSSCSTKLDHINRLHSPGWRLAKRSLDIAVVLLAFPIWLPILTVVGIAVKLSGDGPVFYQQSRVGRGGQPFGALKLRSMVDNADQVLVEYLNANPDLKEEWEFNKKLRHDPRITPLGRWIRKTSLDELPQILNVLRGDMSLVGPRPVPVYESLGYIEEAGELGWRDYCSSTPGITGLWQVNGRNNTTYEDRVGYDQMYVQRWSVWLDLFILARTIKTVLLREGAY